MFHVKLFVAGEGRKFGQFDEIRRNAQSRDRALGDPMIAPISGLAPRGCYGSGLPAARNRKGCHPERAKRAEGSRRRRAGLSKIARKTSPAQGGGAIRGSRPTRRRVFLRVGRDALIPPCWSRRDAGEPDRHCHASPARCHDRRGAGGRKGLPCKGSVTAACGGDGEVCSSPAGVDVSAADR